MATEQKSKTDPPPYASYTSFKTFIKGLKETGVPSQIDRSVMPKLSGSQQSSIIGVCKWFKLIDESGVPTEKMTQIADAYDTEDYSGLMSSLLSESYELMSDGSLDLSKASGQQVAERFRSYGIQGSTVNKTMAFFLAAAKDAGIKISPHVKPPKAAPTGKKRRKNETENDDQPPSVRREPDRTGMVKITVSSQRGIPDGAMYFPEGLTEAQWEHIKKFAMFALENYMYEVIEDDEARNDDDNGNDDPDE